MILAEDGVGVYKKHNFTMRATMSIDQHLPINANLLMAKFQSFVRQENVTVEAKDFTNMDKVPVSFDMPGHYTVNVKESQTMDLRMLKKQI